MTNFELLKNTNLLSYPRTNRPQRKTTDNQFIELESVDSTNNYAMALVHEGLASDGMVCLAHHQSAGRGQRNRRWESEAGKNLMMSLVVEPSPLAISQQFLFSASLALGILDKLRVISPNHWTVKWPNDIYWNDRKAAGILIESVISGSKWLYAVAGIGMNLNQLNFPQGIRNAVSLQQITGDPLDVVAFARELVPAVQKRIKQVVREPQTVLKDFNISLYRRGEIISLKKGGELFVTRLIRVDVNGFLITEAGDFSTADVQWVMNPEHPE